jgi:hypothetical protein
VKLVERSVDFYRILEDVKWTYVSPLGRIAPGELNVSADETRATRTRLPHADALLNMRHCDLV